MKDSILSRGGITFKGSETAAMLVYSRTVGILFDWNKDNEEKYSEIRLETKWRAPVGLVDL